MEKELAFKILGIKETKEEESIQKAYRILLKETNPEDDPEGFKRLRQAYDEARAFAIQKEKEDDDEEKGEVDLWLEQVDQLYQNILSRHKIEEWKKILQNPICEGLDTALEVREKLLAFLMDHIHLPHHIWKLLDNTFEITREIEALQQQFPINFLKYVKHHVENETFIPYDLFEYVHRKDEQINGDAYIDNYLQVKKQIDNGDTEQGIQALDDLKAFGLYHPFEDVEKLRIYTYKDDTEKCKELIEQLEEKAKGQQYVQLYIGEAKWVLGEEEQAYKIWQDILEKTPNYYRVKYNVVRYLMEKEEYYQARELMHDLLDVDSQDEKVQKLLKFANDSLILEYQKKLETGQEDSRFPGDELRLELGWCLFQNERIEEAVQLMESYQPAKDGEYGYYNLYGRLLYQMENYEKALPLLITWLEMIKELKEDGTEETKKRMSRRTMAGNILGGCYHSLGRKEEAIHVLRETIETAVDIGERFNTMQYLSNLLLDYEEYEKSVDLCDQIIREDDQYYPAYLIRQEASYKLRNGQAVVDDYYKLVDMFAGYYKPYLLAAEVYFHYGQYDDANIVLERARENGVKFSSRMKLYEAKILRNLSDSKEDRQRVQKLLEELEQEIQKEECDIEDKSELDFEHGLLCWDNNDLTAALMYVRKAIEQNPERLQYRMICGNISVDAKEYQSALNEYEEAEPEYKDTSGLYYGRGLCYEAMGYLESAMENFQNALEFREVYADACEKLSDYYWMQYKKEYKRSNYIKAIQFASRQIEYTENCYYLVNRGLIYMNAMELESAIKDFEKALEYVPDDWAAWNNMGCCYKYMGARFSKAIGCFKKAVKYMDKSPDVLPYSNMADCYEAMGKYNEAIECYRDILKLFPENTEFWQEIGKLHSYMGQFKEALKAYEKASVWKDYYKNVGDVWLKKGNRRKGIHYYKQGIKYAAGERKAERYSQLGELYSDELREYKNAITCFKRAAAINKDPYEQFAYERYIARAYYMMGNKDKAKKHGEAALEYFELSQKGSLDDYLEYKPLRAVRRAEVGWIYLCIGKVQEAIIYFNGMDEFRRCKHCRYQQCFESRLYLGHVYESLGQYEEAKEEYKKAMARNPHCNEARIALEKIEKG